MHEFYGEVTTSSFESDLRKGNNKSRIWSYRSQTQHAEYFQATGNYTVDVSVDKPSPSPGDTVNFTITANRRHTYPTGLYDAAPPINLKVDIDLTDGLTVSRALTDSDYESGRPGHSNYNQKPSAVRYNSSTGVFNIGTRKGGTTAANREPVRYSVTLPITVSSNAVVNRQCLTARLTGNPPPGTGPYDDDISDNVAKLCLGTGTPGEKVVFRDGTADLWALYPCVGVTTSPCDDTDSVILAINRPSTAVFTGTPAVFEPENVVVHIPDPAGRSVSGGNVWWSNGHDTDHSANGAGILPGLVAKFERSLIGTDNYSQLRASIVANAPGEGSGKGHVSVVFASNFALKFFDTAEPRLSYGPNDWSSKPPLFFRFTKLGTYTVALTMGALYDSDPTDSTPPSDPADLYSDTATYTFHVGPMAELEVRDGGASPHAAADRSALTIVATNNGPDHAPGARVTGLPTGSEEIYASHGQYNGSTGVWDIGELRSGDYYRSAGESEPMLVLGASAGDTATVSIANTTDYSVVISGTTHTAKYYDHKPGNNSATIRAARGTGGKPARPSTPSVPAGPAAPGNPTAQTGTTTVSWDGIGLLYGLPVMRYEVEELQGSRWALLGSVAHNQYAVMQPRGSAYRVRAVNANNAKGPWSASTVQVQAGHAGPPLNLRAQADGNNAIDVFWDAPADVGGSAITGYTVQWSTDRAGAWHNAGSTTASVRTFKHRGLQIGTVRWYRMAARNSGGLGLWSDPVQGQTVSGVPNAPNLNASALSDYQIKLTWNKPADNGQAITGYELEYSADGSADGWQALAEPGAGDTTYTDATLTSNTQRHYRIRANNSVGSGAWSRTVSARTQLEPPTAPTITGVEADGPNAIVVTWQPLFFEELDITQYHVQYAKNQYAETWRGPATLSGSARSWRHTGLKPEETWYYQVRATNGGNRWSVWSYTGSATTASDNAPKAVSGLSAQYDKNLDQITITWNDLSNSEMTFTYELERLEEDRDWRLLSSNATCSAGKCTYADTDIYPGEKLQYRVRAVADTGDKGPWSSQRSVTVPAEPPDEPRISWAIVDGSNHIVIEWEPGYYDGGLPITGYRLLWCRMLIDVDDDRCLVAPSESNPLADPPGYSSIYLGASARTYTHSVTPGYYYFYLLRAPDGGSRWSEWQEYSIYGWIATYAGVPSAPSLTAQALDSSQIRLTWTKPSSYGSEISEYWLYIYRKGDKLYDWDNILDILRVPGDRTEWTIGDLSPGTTRYFRIRALNDNGEGKLSALRQATTHATGSLAKEAPTPAAHPYRRLMQRLRLPPRQRLQRVGRKGLRLRLHRPLRQRRHRRRSSQERLRRPLRLRLLTRLHRHQHRHQQRHPCRHLPPRRRQQRRLRYRQRLPLRLRPLAHRRLLR